MRYLVVILASLTLVACGRDAVLLQGQRGVDAAPCTIKDNIVVCPDGSSGNVQGAQGVPGLTIASMVVPAPLETCPAGGSVILMAQAPVGVLYNIYEPNQNAITVCNGVKGDTGAAGVAGQSATPVTTVQFCQGTPTYPSTFSESGLCIDNKLYGVYSANGGFLTYLPPGAYHSEGIGSRCNFTITENCGVTGNE